MFTEKGKKNGLTNCILGRRRLSPRCKNVGSNWKSGKRVNNWVGKGKERFVRKGKAHVIFIFLCCQLGLATG